MSGRRCRELAVALRVLFGRQALLCWEKRRARKLRRAQRLNTNGTATRAMEKAAFKMKPRQRQALDSWHHPQREKALVAPRRPA